MAQSHPIDQISERVERLLLRHQELQRTNALLVDQVNNLQTERDALKSRLHAARARVEALLDRLPSPDSAEPADGADHKDAEP
jgi:cell division protein ZapB